MNNDKIVIIFLNKIPRSIKELCVVPTINHTKTVILRVLNSWEWISCWSEVTINQLLSKVTTTYYDLRHQVGATAVGCAGMRWKASWLTDRRTDDYYTVCCCKCSLWKHRKYVFTEWIASAGLKIEREIRLCADKEVIFYLMRLLSRLTLCKH